MIEKNEQDRLSAVDVRDGFPSGVPCAQWADVDKQYVQHPYQPGDDVEMVTLEAGFGSTVWDTQGRNYLDARGGGWLSQIGYGRKELGEVAAEQMAALAHYSNYYEFGNKPSIDLAKRLIELSPPSLTKVRFCSTGSEADDEAAQVARYFHYQRGEPDRNVILTIRGGYHGRTIFGSSMSGATIEGIGPYPPGVFQLTPPWTYHREFFCGDDVVDFCVRELEATIEEIGAHRIAALISEPVLGSVGVIPPPDGYWSRISATLRAHGILLIADEVVTAFGRIGEWFGCNYFGIEPDLLVIGKGMASGYLPAAGILVSEEVADAAKTLKGGGSYGGHATTCAVALASIEIIEREELCKAASERGSQLLAELRPLSNLPVVGDIRGIGLMAAVELTSDKESRTPLPHVGPALATQVREETGIIFEIRNGTIYVTPPLVITSAEITRITSALATTLERLQLDGTLRV